MKRLSLPGQINDVDIKLLRVFKIVVECNGFSAAEVELNIGRSAISRLMSDLESRLDMRLCQRGRSGFQLTSHGKLVYDYALELLLDLEKFRSNVNAAHSRLVGELNLALTDNMLTDTSSAVVDVLGKFHIDEPDVRINIQIAAPNDIERSVIEGRTNVGIIPFHHKLPGIKYNTLHQETSLLYCSSRHPLYSIDKDKISVDTIREYDFIAPAYAHSMMMSEHIPKLKGKATSYQVEGIATLILSGQFIGFLPSHYAQVFIEKKQMKSLMPDTFQYHVPFKVITRGDVKLNVLCTAFLNELITQTQASKVSD